MKKERILKMARTDLFFLFKNTKREFISLIEEKKILSKFICAQ